MSDSPSGFMSIFCVECVDFVQDIYVDFVWDFVSSFRVDLYVVFYIDPSEFMMTSASTSISATCQVPCRVCTHTPSPKLSLSLHTTSTMKQHRKLATVRLTASLLTSLYLRSHSSFEVNLSSQYRTCRDVDGRHLQLLESHL